MNIPYYIDEVSGQLMIGGASETYSRDITISGNTGVYTFNGHTTTGWGLVQGIYTGHKSAALSLHFTGTRTPPNTTGTLYYPYQQPYGSVVELYFYISGLSGSSFGLLPSNHYLLTGTGTSGLNCEVLTTGLVKYAGASGQYRPSGLLMHREVYALHPNYAKSTSAIIDNATGVTYYQEAGGIYPSMLKDNILSINVKMTWSGDCGGADNC